MSFLKKKKFKKEKKKGGLYNDYSISLCATWTNNTVCVIYKPKKTTCQHFGVCLLK